MVHEIHIGIYLGDVTDKDIEDINRLIGTAKGRSGVEWPAVKVFFEQPINEEVSIDKIVARTPYNWIKVQQEYCCKGTCCTNVKGMKIEELDFLLFTPGMYLDPYYHKAKSNGVKVHIMQD